MLTLFAVLMGIGVGAFRKVALGRSLAVAQVRDALRAARVFAIEQSSAAKVEVDAGQGVIRASGFVATGNWHFEDDLSRGWPTNATLQGDAALVEDGAVGRALRLSAREPASADLGRSVSFDADRGLELEAFVRLAEHCTGPLIAKGNAFRLALGEGRRLEARVALAADAEAPAEFLALAAESAVPPGRWVQVRLGFDGNALELALDGRVVARQVLERERSLAADPEAALVLGSERLPVDAEVDEVRLATVQVRPAPPLPDGIAFTASGVIRFDGRGRLDPRYHAEPVTIRLAYDEGQRSRDVVVGLLGEVR